MSIRGWLQKWLLGYNLDEFIKTTVVFTNTIASDVATLQENQKKIVELVNILAKHSGGEGWVPTVQNAIMNLNSRIESMGEVVQHHQETLQEMFDDDQHLVELALSTEKDEAN